MIFDYVLYFFIYSVLGFVLETVYAFMLTHKYQVRRTMLFSPMCVVYGVGSVAMLLTISGFSDHNILLFCAGFFVCSSVEYLISLVSERVYNVLWWDYSNAAGNLNGRICAFYSVCWGVIAVIFFQFIHPFVQGLVEGMTPYYKGLLSVICMIYFASDFFVTSRELVKLGRGEKSLCDGVFVYVKRGSKQLFTNN